MILYQALFKKIIQNFRFFYHLRKTMSGSLSILKFISKIDFRRNFRSTNNIFIFDEDFDF